MDVREVLPTLEVLRAIHQEFGEFMLIGSYARDDVCVFEAGRSPARATQDVDVAVAVVDVETYVKRTEHLERDRAGIGSRVILRDAPQAQVDVIPAIADQSVIELKEGVLTDITGMHEAYRSATLEDVEGVTFRVPTLPAMILLKMVAWSMRHEHRDAQDLLELSEAASAWRIDDDDVYCSAQFEQYADFEQACAHIVGQTCVADLPVASRTARTILKSEGHVLLAEVLRDTPSHRCEMIRERWEAFSQGLKEA